MDGRCPSDTRESARARGCPESGSANPAKVAGAGGQGSSSARGSKHDQILQESLIPSANGCSTILRRINTTSSGSGQEELNKSLPLPSQRQGWRGTPRANSQLRVHVQPGIAGCASISSATGSLSLNLQGLQTPGHKALACPEPAQPAAVSQTGTAPAT